MSDGVLRSRRERVGRLGPHQCCAGGPRYNDSLTVFRARALGPTAKSLHTPAPGQGQGSQAVV